MLEQSEQFALLQRVKHGSIAEVQDLLHRCPSALEGGGVLKACRGTTLLIAASQKGRAEMVRCLLEAGADARVRDRWGHTARDYAAADGHMEVVKVVDGHMAMDEAGAGELEILKMQKSLCDLQQQVLETPKKDRKLLKLQIAVLENALVEKVTSFKCSSGAPSPPGPLGTQGGGSTFG